MTCTRCVSGPPIRRHTRFSSISVLTPHYTHTNKQHHIVERHGLKSPEELLAWLDKCNAALAQKQDKDWRRLFKGRNMDVIDKALAKARKGKFYLGLDRTWLSWD